MTLVEFGRPVPTDPLLTRFYPKEVPPQIRYVMLDDLSRAYPANGYATPQSESPHSTYRGWTVHWVEAGIFLRHSVTGTTYYAVTEGGRLWLTMNAPEGYACDSR